MAAAAGPIVHGAGAVVDIGVQLERIQRGHLEGAAAPPIDGLVVAPQVVRLQGTGREHALGEIAAAGRGGVGGEIADAPADDGQHPPGGDLEAVQGHGQGQEGGVQFVAHLGAGIVGLVGVDGPTEAGQHGHRVAPQGAADDHGGHPVHAEHRRGVEHGGLGQVDVLEPGGDFHRGVGPLELEEGLVDLQGRGRIGGGQVAMPTGVLHLDAQAEFHGLAGHEVGAQTVALPDLERLFGLGAGGAPGGGVAGPGGIAPAGEIVAGVSDTVDAGIADHFDFSIGQCTGSTGKEPKRQQGNRQSIVSWFFLLGTWTWRPGRLCSDGGRIGVPVILPFGRIAYRFAARLARKRGRYFHNDRHHERSASGRYGQ